MNKSVHSCDIASVLEFRIPIMLHYVLVSAMVVAFFFFSIIIMVLLVDVFFLLSLSEMLSSLKGTIHTSTIQTRNFCVSGICIVRIKTCRTQRKLLDAEVTVVFA